MRVLLIDDHPALRAGVGMMLEEAGFEVVGEAGNAREGIDLVEASRPDVAVIDLRLPDADGATVCRSIRARFPEVRCLVFSGGENIRMIADAVAGGARGFVYKESAPGVLRSAIERVAAGEEVFPAELLDRIIGMLQPRTTSAAVEELTPREEDILEQLGEGMSNEEIGAALGLSEKTVRNVMSVLFRKLGLRDRTQLALYAHRRRRD